VRPTLSVEGSDAISGERADPFSGEGSDAVIGEKADVSRVPSIMMGQYCTVLYCTVLYCTVLYENGTGDHYQIFALHLLTVNGSMRSLKHAIYCTTWPDHHQSVGVVGA